MLEKEIPADIWCENDVVLTSMRRDHVASTLIQRHFGTKCPLGMFIGFTARVFCECLSVCRRASFPFGFEGWVSDWVVLIPDHCLPFT